VAHAAGHQKHAKGGNHLLEIHGESPKMVGLVCVLLAALFLFHF
jgi:hypothetical protein